MKLLNRTVLGRYLPIRVRVRVGLSVRLRVKVTNSVREILT